MKKKILQLPDYLNKVFEEDCLDLMDHLPDSCVDMVLCDLPYGTTQNKWDSVIPLDKLWERYNRIVKKDGAIVLTSQGIFTAKLILSNEKDFKYKIVWEKSKPTNFLNAKKQPLRKHEDICVFYRNQPTYNPQMSIGKSYTKGIRKDQYTGSYGNFRPVLVESKDGLRYPNDIVYFKTPESEMEGTVWHPTQKPVELGRYLIRTYSNPGDIILDNTSGAGSFLVSALLEQRNFIGIEKNQDARLFKEDTINLIEVTKQRLYTAFYSNTEIPFSKHVSREGLIKEFIHNERSEISV
jgi:site-specific DNA-methyltransferase (adenine-specific)/modification methylase